MIKEFFKNYRDNYLFPIRKQIYDLVTESSRVIDLGCGDGELLRILSPKIDYGKGVDTNKKDIELAKKLNEKRSFSNIEFVCEDAEKCIKGNFDYSVLMFVLHTLDYNSQVKILRKAREISKEILIIDFKENNNFLIYLDETLAGHYKNFKNYLVSGGVENLVNSEFVERFDTYKNSIGIWRI